MSQHVVVRFAPSPTGYLHVGGARTAIFNWLFARNLGGRFLLRIEDTDRARSSDAMTREIFDGLRWLGVDWDSDPVIQSSRVGTHRAACMRLLAEEKAYWCYCRPEDLEATRRQAEAEGADSRYDRGCLRLSAREHERRERAGLPRALRFRVPEGETHFYDMVHEGTTFQNADIEDFVILRSDGSPMYMMAVVCDDHDMGVTHVLRGDDHLPNTPKQILLYEALGHDVPMFGHLPLILGEDKKRLSKRHGATSVGEYQNAGFLPAALFNFLALLGWSPGDDREVMTRPELVEAFDVRRVLKKSSVFDEAKLQWMNGKHIRALPDDELLQLLRPYHPADLPAITDELLLAVIPLMKERMVLLPDIFAARYFFEDPASWDEQGVRKHWNAGTPRLLAELAAALATARFDAASLEGLLRLAAEKEGLGAGKLIHPLRLALTGSTSSPSIFALMEALGRETCLRRIGKAIETLR